MTNPQLEQRNREPEELYRYDSGMILACDTELEKWRAETLFTKEPETIAWIDFWSKKGGTFYDVGANIGAYSVYAAHKEPSLNVCSFEPVLNNYIALIKNKELNKLSNLNVFQIALSSEAKLSVLYLTDNRVGNSGAQVGAPVNEHGDNFEPVDKQMLFCLGLDCMVEEYGFPIPSFIKIDVDGHEMDILKGALRTLGNGAVKSLLIECNGGKAQETVDELLRSKGFIPDEQFNSMENHSSKRRAVKKENVARNLVYSKL